MKAIYLNLDTTVINQKEIILNKISAETAIFVENNIIIKLQLIESMYVLLYSEVELNGIHWE